MEPLTQPSIKLLLECRRLWIGWKHLVLQRIGQHDRILVTLLELLLGLVFRRRGTVRLFAYPSTFGSLPPALLFQGDLRRLALGYERRRPVRLRIRRRLAQCSNALVQMLDSLIMRNQRDVLEELGLLLACPGVVLLLALELYPLLLGLLGLDLGRLFFDASMTLSCTED